jgi:type IV secretion system protein VirD4
MSWLNRLWDILRRKLPSQEKLIGAVPLILVILYLYGVLIHTVQAGISHTFSAEPPSGPVLDWSAATALGTVFSPFGFLFTLIMAGLVFLFTDKFRQWLSGEKLERDKRGFEILHDGLHGTSGWMGKDEQREILQIGPVNELADFPIGKLDEGSQKFAALKNSAYMSGHTIVYGASGSGKTRGCTLPLLMKKIAEGKESLIIVDPKGDLFERTYKFAVENGYTVRALNLLDLDHSDGFNCFDDVERDSSLVSIIAEAIMATTSNKLEREDFWGKAEKNLLMALILYIATLRDQRTGELLPIHERGLGEIYRILSTESFADIDDRFAQLPTTHPAQSPYGIFKLANRQIWGNIAVGLGNRLSTFQNSLVDKITRYNDIDLTLPGKRPCVYYCIISDHDNSMEFLSSMFFSLMFTRLMATARREGIEGRLPIRVNMVLEEFCNIYIANASRLLSVVRSRNIACILLTQGIAQLSDRYPQKEWEEIISNCSVQLVLGVNDLMTAEYCSKKCGVITVRTNTQMSPQNPMFSFIYGAGGNRYSQTRSEGQRSLMLADEITRLDTQKCIALIGGHKPLCKVKPEEIPGFTELQPTRIMDYVPMWYTLDQQRAERAKTRPVSTAFSSEAAVPLSPVVPERFRERQPVQQMLTLEEPAGELQRYDFTHAHSPKAVAPEERIGNMRRYTGTPAARKVMEQAAKSNDAINQTKHGE